MGASACACGGPTARSQFLEEFFLEEFFPKNRVEFWKRIIIILCNLYFVVALKCIDAKSTGVPNWLFPSNCIAHSNQSTKPSFAIYQNVFKGKIISTSFTMHERILYVYFGYMLRFSCIELILNYDNLYSSKK